MTSLLIPRPGCADLPTVAGGDGVYLLDSAGKRYLDGSGGAAVSCLGHSNAAVIAAVKRQMDSIAYAHTSFFTSPAAEDLAAMLSRRAPDALNRAYFVCGGSEATEAALKLARQFHVARGEPRRRYVIGRRQSYHGNTLGALAVGDNRRRREVYAPLLFDSALHIDPCHYWRGGEEGESLAGYGARMANQLEEKILQIGADSVSAFIAETVVGATLGATAAVPGYFRQIRDICSKHGVLLILDEVMCGVGRTGTMFAFEQEGIVPDIVCLAKGLGAGIQPLGAMLCGDDIHAAVAAAGGFQHGHTYICHPAACAAGVAVLREIDKRRLLSQVNKRGERLKRLLDERLGEHPHVGDIRGRGLFWGVEFVADRAAKMPFPAKNLVHEKIKRTAFARGLMAYSMGGTADGVNGDHILLAPPFIVEDRHLEELTDKLAAAVADVLG